MKLSTELAGTLGPRSPPARDAVIFSEESKVNSTIDLGKWYMMFIDLLCSNVFKMQKMCIYRNNMTYSRQNLGPLLEVKVLDSFSIPYWL